MATTGLSGIYEIVNLENGKRYIGSAVNSRIRWAEHRRSLRSGNHHSVALQRAWVKYGENNFVFRLIAICRPDQLLDLEQSELDRLQPEYNICKIAGSTRGFKHSAEARAKMSAQRAGKQNPTKGIKYSPEICARMGAGKIGKKYPPRSEEHRRKLSESNKGHQRALGRKLSEITRAKIRDANLGKRQSIETRLKRATLTEDQVRAIRRMRASGLSYKAIGLALGIKRQLVRRVYMRERYEWVDPTEPVILLSERPRWKRSKESVARMVATKKMRARARKNVAQLQLL